MSPEIKIILEHTEAFKNKDLEGVLSYCSDSIEAISFSTNEIFISGKEALEKHLRPNKHQGEKSHG